MSLRDSARPKKKRSAPGAEIYIRAGRGGVRPTIECKCRPRARTMARDYDSGDNEAVNWFRPAPARRLLPFPFLSAAGLARAAYECPQDFAKFYSPRPRPYREMTLGKHPGGAGFGRGFSDLTHRARVNELAALRFYAPE